MSWRSVAATAHAVATILMLLAFPAGVFVCLAENLWALGNRPDPRRLTRWMGAQAAVGLVFVPWLYFAYAALPAPHPEATGLSIEKASTGFDRPLRPMHIGYPLFTFGAGLTVGHSNRDLHHDLGMGPVMEKGGQVAAGVLITGAPVLIGSIVGSMARCTRIRLCTSSTPRTLSAICSMMRLWLRWGTVPSSVTSLFCTSTVTSLTSMSLRYESISQMSSWMRASERL